MHRVPIKAPGRAHRKNLMKSILDHSFRYTKSIDTDLRKTFARIRREQRQQADVKSAVDHARKIFPNRQRRRSTVL